MKLGEFKWTREPKDFMSDNGKPESSSFKAVFTNMEMIECQWKAHDGQQPDSYCPLRS